jgi:F0F1-type ATP synthase assembly protein I
MDGADDSAKPLRRSFVVRNKKIVKQGAQLIVLGFELAGPVVVGLFAGYFLDRRFDSQPWLMMLGLLAGFFYGLKTLFSMLKRME